MKLSNKSFYVIVSLITLIDQFLKNFVQAVIPNGYEYNKFLHLVYVQNFGVSFGFLNLGHDEMILRILISLIVGLIIVYLCCMKNKNLWIAMILGGAFGNLVDRIFLGYVVDFIDISFEKFHWPAFNFADFCICVGIFGSMFFYKTSQKENVETKKPEEKK